MAATQLQVIAILVIGLCSHANGALRIIGCPGITRIQSLHVSSDGDDCTRYPCKLYKGKFATISVEVTTDKDVAAGSPKVSGVIGGIPLPWSVPAAPNYPIVTNKGGGKWSYVMKFGVSATYPSVQSRVTWKVENDGDSIFCFRIGIMLTTRD